MDGVELRGATVDDLAYLWIWLDQFPKASKDDSSPETFEEFVGEMVRRGDAGEILTTVTVDGMPVGCIGFAPAGDVGSLHGVCFDRAVHGTGVARYAMARFLAMLWEAGYRKISATYFADNNRVHLFLKRCGFAQEGYLKSQFRRDGVPIDARVAAVFRPVPRRVEHPVEGVECHS